MANETDQSYYDEEAPEAVHRTFDVEFYQAYWRFDSEVDTPVFKDDLCKFDDSCAPPYGVLMEYDRVHFPYQVAGASSDELLGLANMWLVRCYAFFVPEPHVCTTDFVPYSNDTLYDGAPSVNLGYSIHKATVDVDSHGKPHDSPVPESVAQPIVLEEGQGNGITSQSSWFEGRDDLTTGSNRFLGDADAVAYRTSGAQPVAASDRLPQALALELVLVLGLILVVPLVWLFSRLRRERILDHGVRTRLFQEILGSPGITEAEAARRLGTSRELVAYHANRLAKNDLITIRVVDRRKYFFKNGGEYSQFSQLVLATMRTGRNHEILALLKTNPELRQAELARLLGVSEPTMSWHLRRLEASAIIQTQRIRGQRIVRLSPEGRSHLANFKGAF
jgi:predicted transcriptional regulator